MKVTHCGVVYDCATAVKCEVNKFIKLYDENALEIASFDNINDFSDYTISGGSFTTPGSCPLPIPLFVFNLEGKTYCALNVKDGERVELAKAADFLPLTGGTLSGHVNIQRTLIVSSGSDNASIRLLENPEVMSESDTLLQLLNNKFTTNKADKIRFTDNGTTFYKLFGEHNKPSGSYTGNGSATAREINIGGIGSLLVLLNHSTGGLALVTQNGSIYGAPGMTSSNFIGYDKCRFIDGVLSISSSDGVFNGSGQIYEYRVI